MYTQPTIMMCPPTFYGIEYEINPWMHRHEDADHIAATQQWQNLYATLNKLGVEIQLLSPEAGLPDLVFTANAGTLYRDHVFLSHFRHLERQGEEAIFKKWFAQHGFDVIQLPPENHFEGAGDTLFCGDTMFAGYIIRSDIQAHQWLAYKMEHRVVPLQLVDEWFYHLDTCFCPLDHETALYYPAAFDDYANRALETHVPELIEVDEEEALRFACNAVVIGKDVVLNKGCTHLEKKLRHRGFTPHTTQLDEFLKAGGSAKCLTLRLDGEEAACWSTRMAI